MVETVRHTPHTSHRHSAKRYYEIWEGKNVLLCRGKFMLGASLQPVIYTLMLINIPAFLEEFLIIRLFSGNVLAGILAPYIVLHILGNAYMIKTITTDPGIIRRYNDKYVNSTDLSSIPQRRTIDKRNPCDVTISTHLMRLKYCRTCYIYRPLRTTHCHECDNCVERFDHHCPWLGVCIGKRNYRSFFLFVLYNTLLITFSIFVSLYRILSVINDQDMSFGDFLKGEPYTLISLLYCFAFFFFLCPLLIFHIWLIKNNMTTNEFWKKTWNKIGVNPYKKKNFMSNCMAIMCLPIKASSVKLREFVYPTYDGIDLVALNRDTGNQITGNGLKSPGEQGQISPEPFLHRKESDKSNTQTNLGQYNSKEENDDNMNADTNKTPPSSAGNPVGEPGMFSSDGFVKGGKIGRTSVNNFILNMQGEPIEIQAKSPNPEMLITPIKVHEDLDNEKSPLSGNVQATPFKSNKRPNSGSVYDSPELYSRASSAKKVVQVQDS